MKMCLSTVFGKLSYNLSLLTFHNDYIMKNSFSSPAVILSTRMTLLSIVIRELKST